MVTRAVGGDSEGPETTGPKLAGYGMATTARLVARCPVRPHDLPRLSMASPTRKGHGSTAQSMRNMIPTVVNGGSPKKWTEHGRGTNRGFERPFLSPRS